MVPEGENSTSKTVLKPEASRKLKAAFGLSASLSPDSKNSIRVTEPAIAGEISLTKRKLSNCWADAVPLSANSIIVKSGKKNRGMMLTLFSGAKAYRLLDSGVFVSYRALLLTLELRSVRKICQDFDTNW